MRTVTFKSVIYGAARLAGVLPDRSVFDTELFATFTEFANQRLEAAWEADYWHELMLWEQRQYRLDWADGTVYAIGDEVYESTTDKYYKALTAHTASAANKPGVSTTDWDEVGDDFDRYIAWEQTGKTKIGEVDRMTKNNPYQSSTTFQLSFDVTANGVQASSEAGNKVWLHFRIRPAVFTSDKYSSTTTYAADDLVYQPTVGECYKSLVGSNLNNTPETSASQWSKIDFPFIFARYVKWAIKADFDYDQGKLTKEGFRDAISEAENTLAEKRVTLFQSQNQVSRARAKPYA